MKIWEYERSSFSEVLRAYRKSHRLTVEKFALECDVSPSTISAYELKKVQPNAENLIKIARAMGIDEVRIEINR